MQVHVGYNVYLADSQRKLNSFASLTDQRNGFTEIALLADSATPGLFYDWSDEQGLTQVPDRPTSFGMASLYCASGVSIAGAACQARHRANGVNVVFADGHAGFVVGSRIRGGNKDSKEWPIVNPSKVAWK